jgi:hypothetical protein
VSRIFRLATRTSPVARSPQSPSEEDLLADEEKRKPDKVARIAAAKNLLLITHAIYRSGERYRAPVD